MHLNYRLGLWFVFVFLFVRSFVLVSPSHRQEAPKTGHRCTQLSGSSTCAAMPPLFPLGAHSHLCPQLVRIHPDPDGPWASLPHTSAHKRQGFTVITSSPAKFCPSWSTESSQPVQKPSWPPQPELCSTVGLPVILHVELYLWLLSPMILMFSKFDWGWMLHASYFMFYTFYVTLTVPNTVQ